MISKDEIHQTDSMSFRSNPNPDKPVEKVSRKDAEPPGIK